MKRILYTLCLVLSVIFFSIKAQDTLRIPSIQDGGNPGDINTLIGGDTLATRIVGDTTATLNNPNRIYLLKRGGLYLTNGGRIQVPVGLHFRLIGEPAPASGTDPGPAVVQVGPNGTGGYDSRFFDIYGDITLKNVWFLFWASNNARQWYPMFWNKDNASADVDNCIFEWSQPDAIEVVGKDMTMCRFTNNIFRNCIDPTQWWAGRMIYFNHVGVDSIFAENNTFENMGFAFQEQDYGLKYFWWNHNTHVNIAKFAFLNEQWQTAFIINNVFFNCHFTGERVADRGGQDPDGLLYGAVLDIDTLYQPPFTNADEVARVMVFSNNSNYTEPWFQTYYDTYNAVPTHSDPILPEPMINERTDDMFYWHSNFVRQNNHDGVDPGFTVAPTNKDSILAFLDGRYVTNTNVDWGWDPDQDAYGTNPRNLVNWPLPENLQYSNSTLLTGGMRGYPLGDLNWYPTQKAAWEASGGDVLTSVGKNSSQGIAKQYELRANYPNPFNPSTTISFSTPKTGNVKIVVSNMLGQQVRTLLNSNLSAGSHEVVWDGKDDRGSSVSSGVYFYQLRGESNFVATKKMILMK